MRQTVYLNVGRPTDRLRRMTVGDVDEGQSVEGFSRALSALGGVQHPEAVPPDVANSHDEPYIRFLTEEEAALFRQTQPRRHPARSRKRRPARRVASRDDLPMISLPSRAPSFDNGDDRIQLPEPALLETAGRRLRDVRLERGLTLDDVHRCTRIPTRSLEALEAGRADGLPAPVYARGFLRCYGRLLDVDLSGVLGEDMATSLPGHGRARPSYRRRRAAVATAAIVVLLGGIVAASAWEDPGRDAVDTAATGRAGPTAPRRSASPKSARAKAGRPKPARTARANQPPAPLAPVVTDGNTLRFAVGPAPVQLSLIASGDCWVRIQKVGRVLYEGTLHAGQRHALTAPAPLDIRLGNPRAITVRVGDRPLTVAGPPDRVANVLLAA